MHRVGSFLHLRIMKMSEARKLAAQAPKYVMRLQGISSAEQGKPVYFMGNFPFRITDNLHEAVQFSVGWDNEDIKTKGTTAAAQFNLDKSAYFKPEYL